MFRIKQTAKLLSALALLLMWTPVMPVAAQLSSPNYRVEETFFGTGGELDASSPNYKAKQSAGELGIGNTVGTNYQAQAGFNTTPDPFLEFTVNSANIDLGYLSTGSTSTATATFSVRAYLTSGYVVTTASDPPKNGNYTLSNLTSPTTSTAGTEQFGINLRDNTSPNIGADPAQLPDTTFGFGAASAGYDQVDKFKYVKNDTIAESAKSSGTTRYTISYIFNISSTTPGGQYTFNHVLVATATY